MGTITRYHSLPLVTSKEKAATISLFVLYVWFFIIPNIFHPQFFQFIFYPSMAPPSPLQSTKGTITCHRCSPLTTDKKKTMTVSLFVIYISFLSFPRFLSAVFSIDLLSVHSATLLPQSTMGTMDNHHSPALTTGKEKIATVSMFVFCISFFVIPKIPPPVFSINLLFIHEAGLPL